MIEIGDSANLIDRKSLSEQVFGLLSGCILSGELKSGEKIPELELAQRFGVSRTPVREAVRKLEKMGLVMIKPRSYAQVAMISQKDAQDFYDVRISLETLAVTLLIAKLQKEDVVVLQEIQKKCLKFIQAGNVRASFEHDSLFHLEIALRSGNYVLYDMLKALEGKIHLVRLSRCISKEVIEKNLKKHKDLIKSIEKQDVQSAIALTKEHILDSGKETE